MIARNERDIEGLRTSGSILSRTLTLLRDRAGVGVPLMELDAYARELLTAASARPAFLGYIQEWNGKAYPAAICTSVNEEVVHAVPRAYRLADGDLLKIDLGVDYNGYITDGALTVAVGGGNQDAQRLLKAAYKALKAGIEAVRPGGRVGDIGAAIEGVVNKAGLKVFKTLTGHGVGKKLHEEPIIWNFGTRGEGALIKEGMVLAIEPMVSLGSGEIIDAPHQAFSEKDGSPTAHFEKTILVNETGCEVLTPLTL